eukprot:10841221-Alexandrium_andersonii.AAC.1
MRAQRIGGIGALQRFLALRKKRRRRLHRPSGVGLVWFVLPHAGCRAGEVAVATSRVEIRGVCQTRDGHL